MRILLAAALALLLAPAAFAQGRIVFGETSHDFGQITEGTHATRLFAFWNEGDASFRLTSVLASCGCTTPEWSRESIAPGDSGYVTVVYDSKGRPGRFHKTVAVRSTAEPDLSILEIEGFVTEVLEDGVRQGHLLIDADSYTFSTVSQGGRLAHTFLVKNVGTEPITIQEAQAGSDAVEVEWTRSNLAPDKVGRIRVLLDTAHLEPGVYSLDIHVKTTEHRQAVKTLTVKGRIDQAQAR